MEIDILDLEGKKHGKTKLNKELFGLAPRTDILHRMVRYQRAKARQMAKAIQGRSDVNLSRSKIYRQKGTGNARHHSAAAPQFRGGAKAHGPVVRNHSHNLNKKFRKLALRHALSSKAKQGTLRIITDLTAIEAKTSFLKKQLEKLKIENALIIDGAKLNENFALAARNIPNVDVLPIAGINVYDILRRQTLVLSKTALNSLQEKFQ